MWLAFIYLKKETAKLSFMFKAHHDLLSTYISDLMPPLVKTFRNILFVLNMNNYSVPYVHVRTEIFKKSCNPSAISLWKSTDNNLKDSNTLQSLKQQLKYSSINLKVPSCYASGNRRLSVLHARIRNDCSNLILDLFNPTCSCQAEAENAGNYFFRSQNYVKQPLALVDSMRYFLPLSLKILL